MDPKSINRPSRQDDEDDLLAFQDEFLRGKLTPAAQVIRQVPPKIVITKKRSKQESYAVILDDDKNKNNFSTSLQDNPDSSFKSNIPINAFQEMDFNTTRMNENKFNNDLKESHSDVQEKQDNQSNSEKKPSLFASRLAKMKKESGDQGVQKHDVFSVVKDVVEKIRSVPLAPSMKDFQNTSTGFPQILHRSELELKSKNETKKAITVVPSFSHTFDDPEMQSIHEENVRKFRELEQRELVEYEEEIQENIRPELIEFLKKRGEQKYGKKKEDNENKARNVPNLEQEESKENLGFPDWIPKQKLEVQKLEWMINKKEESKNSKNNEFALEQIKAIRFSLEGMVVLNDSIPSHTALYHHGEDPDKPGYNLIELLQLSQSTVAGQRIIAMKTLIKLVENLKLRQGVPPHDIDIIEYYMRSLNVLLYFRSALDQKSRTEQRIGISGILSFLETRSKSSELTENDLWEQYLLTRRGHLSIGQCTMNRVIIDAQKQGNMIQMDEDRQTLKLKESAGYTFEEAQVIMENDFVLGLYATNIIRRLSYLLKENCSPSSSKSNKTFSLKILRVLIIMANHSKFLSKKVLEDTELVQILQRNLEIVLPYSESVLESVQVSFNSLKLIRLLTHASKDNCDLFLDISNHLGRFLAFPLTFFNPTTSDCFSLARELQIETYLLLSNFWMYNIETTLFDQFRQTFLSNLQESFNIPYDHRNSTLIAAQLRSLTHINDSCGQNFDAGGPNDAVKPFILLILRQVDLFLNKKEFGYENKEVLIITYTIDLLSSYIRQLRLKECTSSQPFISQLFKHPIVHLYKDCQLWNQVMDSTQNFDRTILECTSSSKRPQYLYGFWTADNLDIGFSLVEHSHRCDLVSSYLDMIRLFGTICPMLPLWNEIVTGSCMNETMILQLGKTKCQNDLQGFMNCGETRLMDSILRLTLLCIDSVFSEQISTSLSKELRQKSVKLLFPLLPRYLPGDEYLISTILDFTLANKNWIHDCLDINVIPDKATRSAYEHIVQVYKMNLVDPIVVERSSVFYTREIQNSSAEFMMLDLTEDEGFYAPIKSDWLFVVMDQIIDEAKTNPNISGIRSLVFVTEDEKEEEIISDNASMIRVLLNFVLAIQRIYVQNKSSSTLLLNPVDMYMRMLNVFLLPPVRNPLQTEIFSDTAVSELLYKVLQTLIQDYNLLEYFSKLSSKKLANLYSLAREVLIQYAAVSFGDIVFGLYLIPFLSMNLPVDYRQLFMTELVDCMGAFNNIKLNDKKISDLFCADNDTVQNIELKYIEKNTICSSFLYPNETNKDVIKSYESALSNTSLHSDTFLRVIIQWHLY